MSKFTLEQIIDICEKYLSGQKTYSELSEEYPLKKGKPSGSFWRWITLYREKGAAAFTKATGNRSYTSEFKQMVVEEYLSGSGSMFDLCMKYDISNDALLSSWLNKYNANRVLKDYCPKPEVYMAEARRKTTIEERKEIVEYCIEHNRNYKETAAKYDVSYSQVYDWVKKYTEKGDDGLIDKRGHHKSDDELSELELLRRENIRLKRKLEEQEKIALLLKKVQEFERM